MNFNLLAILNIRNDFCLIPQQSYSTRTIHRFSVRLKYESEESHVYALTQKVLWVEQISHVTMLLVNTEIINYDWLRLRVISQARLGST